LGKDDLANQLVLGKYLILGQLSEGSLGSIYLGRADRGRGDPVFVKSISPLHLKSDEAVELFAAEVTKLQGVRHPNLAAVLDHGDEGGSQLVVSEYVPGFDLGHWFAFTSQKRGRLPIGVAVHIAIEMLNGLEALHQSAERIVHRDLMPSNVVIDRNGRVRVTDFGLSRVVSEGTAVLDPNMTGKLAYLTPELVAKNEPGPPSDVYGAALVLYEILTGENPFAGDNLGITISAVLMKEPPPARSLRDDLPDKLSQALAGALAKKPEDRPAHAADFARTLDPFAGDRSELAAMVAEDFRDPDLLEIKEVVSLEERERILGKARTTKPTAPPRKPPTRLPTEQRERAQISASGEVVARSRSSRDSEVVWRKPSTIVPPVSDDRRTIRLPLAWILVGIAGLALVAILIVLIAR
jgi:serine/threonine protein kinase